MVKTWLEVAPDSLLVVEDVDHLPVPLGKIIAAEGCVVPGEFLRTGRRMRRADGTGECAGEVRKRQRKATLVAKKHHPELDEAYAHLMSVESAKSVRPRGAMQGLFRVNWALLGVACFWGRTCRHGICTLGWEKKERQERPNKVVARF